MTESANHNDDRLESERDAVDAPALAADTVPSAAPPDEPMSPETEAASLDAAADDSDDDSDSDDNGGDDGPLEEVQPLEEISADEDAGEMQWFILKVMSMQENRVCDAIWRRVRQNALEHHFNEIVVPTEDVAEYKNGKRRVVKRKLYPGYIMINMVLNDDTWFLVRDTAGVGDFTGSAGRPTPMESHDIDRILRLMRPQEATGDQVKTAISFKPADRVRVKDGNFENFEGEVESIDEANGRVTVMISIFGRSTPVEFEHWQLEAM